MLVREPIFKDATDDEKTPRGAYQEYRRPNGQMNLPFIDRPKSLITEQQQLKSNRFGASQLPEKAVRMNGLENEGSPMQRLDALEAMQKNPAIYDENLYDGYQDMPLKYDNRVVPAERNGSINSPAEQFQENKQLPSKSGNYLNLLNTKNQFSVPLLEQPGSEDQKNIVSNRFVAKDVSDTRTSYKQASDHKKFRKAPTQLFTDSHRLDFLAPTQYQLDEFEVEHQNPYLQQSNRFENFHERSEENLEEKGSQGSLLHPEEMLHPRGAVTQGLLHERRRKQAQTHPQNPTSSPQYPNPSFKNAPNPFSPHPPYPYSPQYPNEQLSLPHPSTPITPAQYPIEPIPPEPLRAMDEIMTSMLAFQHNNFRAMIDSHTQLMNKMIDKMWHKKRRYKEYSYRREYDKDDQSS